MEAAGTGFDKIVSDYADADENHKPYIFSSSDHFTLVLPDLTYSKGIQNVFIPVIEVLPTPPISDHDEKILPFVIIHLEKQAKFQTILKYQMYIVFSFFYLTGIVMHRDFFCYEGRIDGYHQS